MPSKISNNSVVTLAYSVTDPDGSVVDEGRESLIYLHGGYGDIFSPIEDALAGKTIGETVEVKLQPEDAFGEYDESLVQIEALDQFPHQVEIGMHFEGSPADSDTEEDDEDYLLYRVTEIADNKVVLDGNHPLAGMALIFNCTVMSIRSASGQEIEQGFADKVDEEKELVKH